MKNCHWIIVLLLIGTFIGCGEKTAEQKESEKVSEQQSHFSKAQPVTKIDWSLERDVANQLYQARNERVRTWTVWRSDYGLIEGHHETIGYPIPYDVQLTNPTKIDHLTFSSSASYGVIDQAEPNGLYSSRNSIATWIRAVVTVDGKTIEAPIYIEGKVTCYPYPVKVDYETNRVTPVQGVKPSVILKQKGE